MKLSSPLATGLAVITLITACSSQKPAPISTGTIIPAKLQIRPGKKIFFVPPTKLPGEWTVADVLHTYGDFVKNKLNYYFAQAQVSYPPKEMVLIALKEEKKLELWARDSGEFRLIRDYFIMAASGFAGPKLRQGDRQVPEGIYRIVDLNPNSHFHLSMKLNYPNEFDQFHAWQERRYNPGSDIFIHGKSASIGCLAMGDAAIEELFVLTAKVGAENVKVVIAPHDPRIYPLQANSEEQPRWVPELYANITREIHALSPIAGRIKARF